MSFLQTCPHPPYKLTLMIEIPRDPIYDVPRYP